MEAEKEISEEVGYDRGVIAGRESGRREQAARVRELEAQNARLTAQVAAKAI